MAITRYSASADTTISDAYELNLTTRASGANMGAADVLETFMIYNQAGTGSIEKSRILIKFPTTDISADRTAGNIPASGSVSFYLRMFNVAHAMTTPKAFTLSVRPITTDWQEGQGLDMETYKDVTRDKVEGANWNIAMSGSDAKAVAKVTAASKTAGQANTRVLSITDAGAQTVDFQIDNSISTSTATKIAFGNANSNATQFATNIAAAVNAANSANTCNVTATSSGAVVTLTQDTAGLAGQTTIEGTAVDDSVVSVTQAFSNLIAWTTTGGDYDDDSTYTSYTQTFTSGTEDMNINVTSLVEEWIAGTKSNYGVGVHLTGSVETGSVSLYTKKFFARSSEYYLKRPVIEARWDSTKKDDRGNFYVSSSLVPETDNVNTLYLYNYVRGQLKNIPSVGAGAIYVTLHTGSGGPSSSAIELKDYNDAAGSSENFHTFATGGYVETGVYTASVVITGALSGANEYYYDVWSTGQGGNTLFTGSGFVPKTFGGQNNINPDTSYFTKVTNLRSKYSKEDTPRFRLHVRPKDWSPNIYTVASKEIENTIIEDAYYKVYRIVDNFTVIDYGTGSTTPETIGFDSANRSSSSGSYTRLSFDVSGNYFDLDMSLMESGYSYGVKFLYYNNGYYHEQPELFKFRVEK